ncbi:hypothetical protein [Parafrankia sp. BMG5.11]|uniref:hypothetical protein n=1 Tax=Parafrankia sp. BMG5.11 TaxID=222540 RepID=UPI00103F3AEE|nr:hypothetical protein [Parafrankia sp. BMG5.11]
MILASFTEGIGLLMLVPITQIVAEEGSQGLVNEWAGDWGASLASMPLALLLGGFVALVALRAVLTHALLMRRATLSLPGTPVAYNGPSGSDCRGLAVA